MAFAWSGNHQTQPPDSLRSYSNRIDRSTAWANQQIAQHERMWAIPEREATRLPKCWREEGIKHLIKHRNQWVDKLFSVCLSIWCLSARCSHKRSKQTGASGSKIYGFTKSPRFKKNIHHPKFSCCKRRAPTLRTIAHLVYLIEVYFCVRRKSVCVNHTHPHQRTQSKYCCYPTDL